MKFVLQPYNRGLSDEELLNDLRAIAQSLNKTYVTKDEYNQAGRLCSATLQNRFGSWCKAHELAGLQRIRYCNATADDCIVDIRRVAAELGKTSLTLAEYLAHGKYGSRIISRRIGLWNLALTQAGLISSSNYHLPITDEQLFENLEHLWESLGRQPTRDDFVKPLSRFSYSPYPRRFGTYRKALEAFVESFETQNQNSSPVVTSNLDEDFHKYPEARGPKTSRTVGWRLRFLVMRRDGFKCRICGCTPAVKPGTVLVIDHIKAWAAGGETEMDNLQTLCEPCNGGKATLLFRDFQNQRQNQQC